MGRKYPRRRSSREKPERRPLEFSKMLAAWAVVVATAATTASFYLAAHDKSTASDWSTTICQACIGYLITYAAKSATEKSSRNRHGLDVDGNPIDNNMEE